MVEGWPLLFKLSLGVLLEMRPLIEVRVLLACVHLWDYKFDAEHLRPCTLSRVDSGVAACVPTVLKVAYSARRSSLPL